MGEVYLADDTRLGRKIALKLLPTHFTTDKDRLRRFEQEARAAGALSHPNIVTVFDIGETGGVSWIAMERVDGHDLRLLSILADQAATALERARELVEGANGTWVGHNVWGRRRLAYEIDHKGEVLYRSPGVFTGYYKDPDKTAETVVDGLGHAPGAFIDLLRGGNTGKMLVRL